MYSFKHWHITKLESSLESLIWTVRVARWNRTFPRSYKELKWDEPPCLDGFYLAIDTWTFLAPFFASRGYVLYHKVHNSGSMVPAPSPDAAQDNVYPFSRLILNNRPPKQYWGGLTTWTARDRLGRDVVIKAISDVSQPSDELKIMLRLNDEKLRSDPFNHTICALEFLTFDELVFVVMPRWDPSFTADFATVSELMEITQIFLEVFVFLHKNKIVHHDFLDQNTGMNVVVHSSDLSRQKGLRNPGEVQYALFDFNNSIAYPEDSIIDDMIATRRLNYGLRNAARLAPKGPYNPFKADIAFLGLELQRRVRHVEHVIPELSPFFDRLVDCMDPNQLSAPQALSRFMEIYNGLSSAQLQEPVHIWLWKEGVSVEKGKNYHPKS